MTTFALDTNIISYMLKDDDIVFKRYDEETRKGNEFVIPPVAYYEIKRGLLFNNAIKKARSFDLLCNEFIVGNMNTATWDEAARLYSLHRKHGHSIEDADLFIAAFCLVNGYTLVTNNLKHFTIISGLKCTNWKE